MSNKKSVQNFRRTRAKVRPAISEAEHKFNCERITDSIMSVIDRLPANPAPVAESFEELLDQMRNGVKRSPVVVNNHSGELVKYNLDGSLEVLNSPVAGSVAAPNPEDITKFESTAEDQNQTAKLITDVKRQRSSDANKVTLQNRSEVSLGFTKHLIESSDETFTESEKLILKRLENGE